MDNESEKQRKNNFDWLKAYAWKKGQSGNPNGRPKTKTLKEFARELLANMSDEDRIEFLKTLPHDFIWKMSEGNPETRTDITTAGKELPQPLLNIHAIQRDDSPKESSEVKEED